MNVKSLIKNSVAKNASWLIAGRVAQMLISFVVNILMANFLEPANYGLVNYGATYTNFFMSLCTLGINSVLVKELVDHRNEEGKVLGTSMLLKAIASFLSALMIIGIVSFLDADEPTTIAVVALCSIGLIFNVLETFNYWFQSNLQSKITAIAVFSGYIITAAYKIYLIAFQKSVIWFSLATSLDYVCVGVLLIVFYKKYKGGKLYFSFEYAKELLKTSSPFILPALMVSIYAQTDKIMLKQIIDEAEIGYYSTAVMLCQAWCFVLQAIIDSLYPPIMESHKTGNLASFEKQNKMLYALVFYISITVSLLVCLLAKPVISILYSDAYLPTIAPLKIITWYTAFSYLGVARNAWIVSENKQKYLIWVYVSAAVANVILNLIFIPLWKSSGAAAASLVSQIITTMITPFFIKELRPNAKMMLDAILLKGILPKKGKKQQ